IEAVARVGRRMIRQSSGVNMSGSRCWAGIFAFVAAISGCQSAAHVDTSGVGAPCAADMDCHAGLTCFLGPPGARPWVDGYCTRACTIDDCPGTSRCAEAWTPVAGEAALRCLASCDRVAGSSGGCRAGYSCTFDGVCLRGCLDDAECETVDVDPGTPASVPGSVCQVASSRCLLPTTGTTE